MLYEDAKQMGGHHPALCACAGPASAEDDRAGRPGVLHLRRRESSGERAGKDARRPGNIGGVLIDDTDEAGREELGCRAL
jgi:hypothetical protein